jgi:hypothetical protein
MASITTTMTQEVENAINYSSLLQNRHSKTLDIGLNGYTMSTGQLGDVSRYEMLLNLSQRLLNQFAHRCPVWCLRNHRFFN